MKNLSIILLGICLSAGLYAHCGSCGVGSAHDKKTYHEKYVESIVNLTDKQKKKLKKLSVEMKKDIKKIKSKYRKSVVKLIGEEKADQYLKSMKR